MLSTTCQNNKAMNHKINNAEKLTPVDDWLVGHFPLTMLLFGFQNAAKNSAGAQKLVKEMFLQTRSVSLRQLGKVRYQSGSNE